MELLSLSAVQLGRLIKEGKATAVEAMRAVLEQIDKSEELYNCYVTIDREKALKKAAEVQQKIESGELSAGRRARGCEGQSVHGRDGDYLRFPDSWELHPHLFRGSSPEAGTGWRSRHRQDKYGRICHGFYHGDLRLRPYPKSS